MDAEIIYDNGERFKLSDLSVKVIDFKVSSMVKQSVYEDIEGATRVDYGAEYKHRTISIPFVMTAYDLHDFAHLRNEIFAKVDSLESFYIREMRRPIKRQYEFVNFNEKPKEREGTDDQYVDGKQYRVRLVNVIEIEQRGVKGDGVLVFETTESPYAQSVYTTLELHDSGYSATAEKYGLVDNIDDEKVKYRFEPERTTSQTIDLGWSIGSYNLTTGESNTDSRYMKTTMPFTSHPGGIYTIRDLGTQEVNVWIWIFEYNAEMEFIGSTGFGTVSPTIPRSFVAQGNYIYISVQPNAGQAPNLNYIGNQIIPVLEHTRENVTFSVYNAGNVTIEPESMMLNIFASSVHSSGNFTIRNKTTDEEIVLHRESNGSHFVVNGMLIRLGGIPNIFRDTNRRFISLAPGDNEFEISNGTFEEIRFDFKYLYK